MVGVDANGDGDLSDAGDTTYLYDADGVRVKRTLIGGTSTQYLNDDQNPTGYSKAIEERDNGGTSPARGFVIGHDIIAQVKPAETLYFLKDGRGTTRALLETSGAAKSGQTFDFDAFSTLLGSVTPETEWLAADGRRDAETGFTYSLARYRDAWRFVSMDDPRYGKSDEPVSLHKYLYANGNPTNAIDPSGHSTFVEATAGVAVGMWMGSTLGSGPGFSWLTSLPSMRSVLSSEYGEDFLPMISSWVRGADAWTLASIHAQFSDLQIDVIHQITLRSAALTFMLDQLWLDFLIGIAGSCFVAGTHVIVGTNENRTYVTRSIEDLRPGDLVLARDEDDSTDDLEPKRVVRVFHKVSDHLRILKIRGHAGNVETIQTTDEHPFWVEALGWIRARDLRAGMHVDQPDGSNATVIANVREEHPQGIAVYNLEVEGDHTYFVEDGQASQTPIWVHNRCAVQRNGANFLQRYLRGVGDRWGGRNTRALNHKVAHVPERDGI